MVVLEASGQSDPAKWKRTGVVGILAVPPCILPLLCHVLSSPFVQRGVYPLVKIKDDTEMSIAWRVSKDKKIYEGQAKVQDENGKGTYEEVVSGRALGQP